MENGDVKTPEDKQTPPEAERKAPFPIEEKPEEKASVAADQKQDTPSEPIKTETETESPEKTRSIGFWLVVVIMFVFAIGFWVQTYSDKIMTEAGGVSEPAAASETTPEETTSVDEPVAETTDNAVAATPDDAQTDAPQGNDSANADQSENAAQ